ncbi:MAG: transglycosylase domain-containing protein [Anaerolineae bacterium]
MSERPENPQNDDPNAQGGWQAPRDANPWRSSDTQSTQTVKWRQMKALSDFGEEPTEPGMWHQPDAEDTVFGEDDVVEVPDEPRPKPTSSALEARPEDLIAEILQGTSRRTSAPNPEDYDYSNLSQAEGDDGDPTRAADAFEEGETLLVDEESATTAGKPIDLDDEAFSMGEYMALANLAQGDDDDLAGLEFNDLSPAEQALYSAALNTADEMDSKKIAEAQLDDEATMTLEDTGGQPVNQAQSYAAEQLRALQEQGGDQPADAPAPAQRTYTPEERQLAQQFRETKRQVAVLRQMQQQGQIDQNELQIRLQEHTILDPQGNWWMIGFETDDWYRYNNQNGQWESAAPPVPLEAADDLTETGIGETAPDVMPGSLPYLPNDGSQGNMEYSDQDTQYDNTQYSTAQQNYTERYGVQENPLPKANQPTVDPNLTQVGTSADLTQLNYADQTLQNMNRVDDQATMQSEGFSGQQTMPSASFNDAAYDDYYNQQDVPPPAQYDDGFNQYEPQAAPDHTQLERQSRAGMLTFIAFGLFGLFIVGLLTVGGFIWWAQSQYSAVITQWQDEVAALGTQNFDFQTATILAADGTVIAELTGEEGARTAVSIENGEVSPYFIHAIVASEDPRFYENPGVDPLAIARAFFQNYFAGEVVSGASTITQQIVRERIIGNAEVTLDRKLVEALVAIEVANNYSKNQILDIYINEFFYGEQSYGVEAAAEFYFDTTAAELDAAQAATLAGILPSPSSSNPVVAPAVSFSNMRIVLNRMIDVNCLDFQHGEWAQTGEPFCVNAETLVDDGSGNRVPLYRRNPDGTFGGFLALQIAQVETRRYEPRQSDIRYPHFVFYVLGELDNAFGRGAYIERGFTIQTTLVPRIQNTAENALQQGVEALQLNGVQTGAVLVTDPRTGAVLAMVGSPDFNDDEIDGQNNNTLSLQQPGSAIKPVVYATALTGTDDSGYFTPASILWDVPTSYNIGGTTYQPLNFDRQYRGPVSVRYALAQSLNVPAVKTYAEFNTPAFVSMANALGINFDPNPNDEITPSFGLPTAIGATEVSLMDLTQAYATIANDGVRNEMYAVTEITERTANGNEQPVELPVDLSRNEGTRAISAQVAYLLQNILSDDNARSAVVNNVRSTFPANSAISGAGLGLQNQNQVGAKTGTNNTVSGNPSRIWTVGFTNNYAVGIWMGTLNQGTPMTGRVTGFTGAAPVWNAIMREALNGANPGSFDNPGGVVQDAVCLLTGTLAPQASNCPNRVTELFVQTLPPPPPDEGFAATIEINSWTGLRANQWCAENVVTETFANIDDPFAVGWLNDTQQGRNILSLLNLPANLAPPPQGECQQGQPLPTVQINFPQENSRLEGVATITGQVSASELQRWEIQIAEAGTDNFRSVMSQPRTEQVPTGGSTLYEWDTTTVSDGNYILRLAAYSNQNGGFIFRDVRVVVDNPEPTQVPPTPTPFSIELTPLPFDELTPSSP